MDAVVTALAEQHVALANLVEGIDESDWQRPSACAGWSVSDVLLHLAQTDEMAIGSATGQFDRVRNALIEGLTRTGSVDDGADAMVARDRGGSGGEVLDRWRTSAAALRDALAACDPHARVMWVAGELSARTLATTRLAEAWIHTGDVGFAFGRSPEPVHRLWHVARLAWRTLPHAFGREGRPLTGPVAFELTGPAGEEWSFGVDDDPLTVITGPAIDLVLVASRRVEPAATTLRGEGPDAEDVLALVRTWA